jgi:hypothetical protein
MQNVCQNMQNVCQKESSCVRVSSTVANYESKKATEQALMSLGATQFVQQKKDARERLRLLALTERLEEAEDFDFESFPSTIKACFDNPEAESKITAEIHTVVRHFKTLTEVLEERRKTVSALQQQNKQLEHENNLADEMVSSISEENETEIEELVKRHALELSIKTKQHDRQVADLMRIAKKCCGSIVVTCVALCALIVI